MSSLPIFTIIRLNSIATHQLNLLIKGTKKLKACIIIANIIIKMAKVSNSIALKKIIKYHQSKILRITYKKKLTMSSIIPMSSKLLAN
jgi:hypothetical protein